MFLNFRDQNRLESYTKQAKKNTALLHCVLCTVKNNMIPFLFWLLYKYEAKINIIQTKINIIQSQQMGSMTKPNVLNVKR